MELTGSQRRFLRARGHELNPVVQIGHAGLTEGVVAEIDAALEAHELIKVRLGKHAPLAIKEAAAEAGSATGSAVAQTIGHVMLLYRPAEDPRARKIRLPKPRTQDEDSGSPDEE